MRSDFNVKIVGQFINAQIYINPNIKTPNWRFYSQFTDSNTLTFKTHMILPIPDLEIPTFISDPQLHHNIKQIELQNHSQKSKSSIRKLTEKPQNTIEVLSDEEEEHIISQKFQEEVFRAKIEEAKLTKSKNTILKVLYVELNFKNKKDNEKENRFNSMVRMFISKNLKTSIGEPFDLRISHFFNQMMPIPGEGFVQNEYILYGCDLLPHKHIEKMFQSNSPSIKWIDASHCRLTFMTKIQGWDAVINNCLDFEYLKRYMLENEKVEQLMDKLELEGERQMEEQHETKYTEEYFKLQKFKKEYYLLKDFIELMPYYELGFKRRLFIRNVTSSEQLIGYNLSGENKSEKSQGANSVPIVEVKKPESQYKKYLRIKQALWREIQNSPLVKPEYQRIQKQILRQKELLWYGKRPAAGYQNNASTRQYQNHNQRNQNYNQRGNYNQSYPQRSFNDNHPYKNNYQAQQFPVRNRSRDQYFQERHYPRGDQQYRERGFDNQNHNKFYVRNDKLEMAFDNYIERRDEVRIIQNPHKYLQPEFYDNKTGLHFYRNPFYNPPLQAQLSYPNYDYQEQPEKYQTPTPAYDYGSQSINNTNLSGYQYDGNKNGTQNLNPSHYDQRQSNQQKYPLKKSHHQRTDSKQSVNSHKKNISAEEMFNTYCAQRNQNVPQEQIILKNNKKIPSNNIQVDQNDPLFEADDFSIITEQKSQNPKGNDRKLLDQNLENILDQIHQDEHSISVPQKNQQFLRQNFQVTQREHINVYDNDEDSCDLEFMLRERQEFNIKSDVKQQHQPKSISNIQKGFIEQKIKEEHIPNWIKSNHVVDDLGCSQQVSNLAVNGSQFSANFDEIVCDYPGKMSSESAQNMKKKIHVKKSKDSSSSKSKPKRQGQSLTKNSKK